ncbi:UTP--glucose-1-phosphate uridylyltransferase [Agrilactobacillus fermenti]|uniref:UTP--glucose-1-phosphate uridylyltransferase n=1 Tax=Agrilactobacillus fermenti TaxID=2586909 RepID=UPI003A5BE50B
MKVRKAVIAAGGFGLSLLPATKAVPKEILPVFDRPVIDYLVREAQQAGITDILLISGKRKRAIEDYFDAAPDLEIHLAESHKNHLLAMVKATDNVNLYFVKQNDPTGIGDALLLAEDFVDNEPFVVMLSDDIVLDPKPLTQQLIADFNRLQQPILGVQSVSSQATSSYGIVELADHLQAGLGKIKSIVEKPGPVSAPSSLGIIGRYVLPGSFFEVLRQRPTDLPATEQLSAALNQLNQTQQIYAREFTGQREDISGKFGLLKATIDYGLNSEEYGSEAATYIKQLVANNFEN